LELISATNTTTQTTGGESSAGLFNAGGAARRLRTAPLFAIGPGEPGPALRRGVLVAVPIGAALAFEFGFNSPTEGAIATAALVSGFVALDAPAGPRAAWLAAASPLIGIGAALGVLSSQFAPAAVVAMGLLGAAAGICFAVSLRLAFVGLCTVLALLISQGLFLPVADAPIALLWGTAGGLLQAAWSFLIWLFWDRAADDGASGWNARRTAATLRANLTLRSVDGRHALRFGGALAIGVAIYRILGLHEHGFWIPLTILFVLRPERDETEHRLVLRALGTLAGLIIATALAETVGGNDLVVGIVLTISAALAFGLLTVQYALFTTAITTYVVLITDHLGEPALRAAGQRALGTAVGIVVAYLVWALWSGPGESEGRGSGAGALAERGVRQIRHPPRLVGADEPSQLPDSTGPPPSLR
jgi:hypothetical protein